MFTADFANQLKESFGILSNNLREPEKRFFLLRRDEHSADWIADELTDAYHVSFVKDTFRNTILFKSFSTEEDFPDRFALATHCAWGVPDEDEEIELYAFDPEQKDVSASSPTSPLWRAAAFQVPNERFTVPG